MYNVRVTDPVNHFYFSSCLRRIFGTIQESSNLVELYSLHLEPVQGVVMDFYKISPDLADG